MPGTPIPPSVLNEVQRQLNHELAAAHSYQALAIWCEGECLTGFASFFTKQAAEERIHAEKFIKYLHDRGEVAKLAALPPPKTDFGSIVEIAKEAQLMEQANTAGIVKAYEEALSSRDYPSQVLLQWFIAEQVEEEAWAQEMIDRTLRANCAGGLTRLDHHIEKYLTAGA